MMTFSMRFYFAPGEINASSALPYVPDSTTDRCKNSIWFEVDLVEEDCLELATEEVLEGIEKIQRRKKNKVDRSDRRVISPSLGIHQIDTVRDPELNEFRYIGSIPPDDEDEHDGLIDLNYQLSSAEFASLRAHLLAGLRPRQIVIECKDEALSYGIDPDGRVKKWDNVAKRSIAIYELSFVWTYHKRKSEDQFWDELIDPEDYESPARVALDVFRRLHRLEKIMIGISVAAGIACALLAALVWKRAREVPWVSVSLGRFGFIEPYFRSCVANHKLCDTAVNGGVKTCHWASQNSATLAT